MDVAIGFAMTIFILVAGSLMDVNLEFDMDIIEAISLGQVAVNAKMFAAQAVATILRTVDFLTSM